MANERTYATGDAAKRIGEALDMPAPSRQTVRRLIDRGELETKWTRPRREWRRDMHGRLMRGHRRIVGVSLEKWIESERERLEAEAQAAREEPVLTACARCGQPLSDDSCPVVCTCSKS